MDKIGRRKDIEEVMCGSNFAYVLAENGGYSPTEYKVMQSQSADSFVKCMRMQYNGRPQFYYITEGRYTLEYLLPSINGSTYLHIITNILKNALTVKKNGFLSCCNIDLSADKIYIDNVTHKVFLVYVPLNNRLYKEEAEFENDLRRLVCETVKAYPNVASSKSIQFAEDVQNPMLSLNMLYKKLGGAVQDTPKKEEEKPGSESRLRLVAIGGNKLTINVDKDNFLIGKDASKVDGVIGFNKYIGRVHCRINRIGGQYFVTDLNSTNHTYLDKVMLSSSKAYPLQNGSILRLANSDFRIETV